MSVAQFLVFLCVVYSMVHVGDCRNMRNDNRENTVVPKATTRNGFGNKASLPVVNDRMYFPDDEIFSENKRNEPRVSVTEAVDVVEVYVGNRILVDTPIRCSMGKSYVNGRCRNFL